MQRQRDNTSIFEERQASTTPTVHVPTPASTTSDTPLSGVISARAGVTTTDHQTGPGRDSTVVDASTQPVVAQSQSSSQTVLPIAPRSDNVRWDKPRPAPTPGVRCGVLLALSSHGV